MGSREYVLGNVAIVIVYAASGALTWLLQRPYGTAGAIWIPSGIGFALIVMYGARWVPGVAAGTFIAVLLRHHALVALFASGLEVLEAVTVYALLRRLRFRPQLDRERDVLAVATIDVIVTLVGSVIGSLIAVHTFVPLGWSRPESMVTVWPVWWWTNISGDLIVGPVVFTWLSRTSMARRPGPWETVVLIAGALLVTMTVFASWLPGWVPAARAPYYVLPVLLWAGIRFGPRGAATASLVVSLSAIVVEWLGFGAFPRYPELQVFVTISAMTALLVSAFARERAREIERRGAIQEAALDAIITTDDRGRILELNPAAEQLFRFDEGDVVGKDLGEIMIPPRLRQRYYDGLHRYINTGTSAVIGSKYRTTAWRACDGQEFPVEIAVTRVPIDDELVLTGFVRDTSAEVAAELVRRDAEATLERKVAERTAELRRALEQGDTLLREIHHRVKNNLQVISSLLHLQAATTTSELARVALVESQNRVAAMALVHEMLYESKDIESIEVGEYLRGLADRLAMVYNLDTTQIVLEVDAQPLRLDLDRAISCGVLVNELVTNAILHAFPKGRKGKITIRVAQIEDTIDLVVDDDGIGMPTDFRIEGASTFGLTLVHALAAQLDGTISLLRTPGTAIRIAFPAVPRKRAAA